MSKNEAAGPRAAEGPSPENDAEAPGTPPAGPREGRPGVVKVLHKDRVPTEADATESAPPDGAAPDRAPEASEAEPAAERSPDEILQAAAAENRRMRRALRMSLREMRQAAALAKGEPVAGAAAAAAEPAGRTAAGKAAAGADGKPGAGPKAGAAGRRKRAQTSKLNVSPRKAGAPAIPVMPTATAARRKSRHVGLMLSFLLVVVAPVAVAGWYLYERAADQYASNMGFSVRKEDSASASEMIGGLIDFGGGSTSDTDVLYEYIQSQALVQKIDERIDLRTIYSKPEEDWFFSVAPDAPIEELVRYWRRMVTIYYDGSSGLIETRVLAFTAEDAQRVSQAIFDESSDTINRLTSIAREDATKYARRDLEQAEKRLREARSALTQFRARTQIVDPAIDVQGQMGLVTTLQQQLAEALIELDLLRDNTRDGDPRIRQAEQRIEVIRKRIDEERSKFGVGETVGGRQAYVSLVGEYESLSVDREFAEQTYLVAQANHDAALAEAQRQSRYLAAYTTPTLAESSEYPQRIMLLGVLGLFAIGAWSVGALIYYSIRDRR